MSLACKVAVIATSIVLLADGAFAGQKGSDRWFAKDKYEHFAISACFSAAGAKIAHRHFDFGKDNSIAIGFGFTFALGAGKEVADSKYHKGTASFKDLLWDFAGAACGSIMAGLLL